MKNFEEINYENFEDFYRDFFLPNGKYINIFDNNDQIIFRGEESDNYTLLPSALRPQGRELIRAISPIKNSSDLLFGYIEEELGAVCEFCKSANLQGLYIPEVINSYVDVLDVPCLLLEPGMILNPSKTIRWIPKKFYEVFSLAQHYGIPTRLLDFTYDINIALYFSCVNKLKKVIKNKELNDKNFVIWIMNIGIKTLGLRNDINLKIILPRYNNNYNITSQKGLFIFLSENVDLDKKIHKNKPLDEVIKEATCESKKTLLYKILLPNKELLNVFTYLRRAGYSHSRVYPGYGKIIEDLKERNGWSYD